MADSLKKRYRDLETGAQAQLREKIAKSKLESKHVDGKCIKVNFCRYTEMVIVDDRLTFLDASGYHYSIFAEASLEDLIWLLED